MSVIIQVNNLGKKYTINHEPRERYTALRDVIANKVVTAGKGVKRLLSFQAGPARSVERREDFWALRGVNFEVNQGDRVGVIGRNGAGKSTLLKLLSRITEPSEGVIKIRGRVASLLEVGTGFHPELTGRENVFLNGAILGMTRTEVKRKFDEIVEFAEVEQFLDTPVKRFSSGMYVRLAFAVAAHLEPDILLVDEVLSVGDLEFQKKCLGKMEDVSRNEGRTVIFVSHNMPVIQNLCENSILLNHGKVVVADKTSEVINRYLKMSGSITEFPIQRELPVYFRRIEILDNDNSEKTEFLQGEDLHLLVDIRFGDDVNSSDMSFDITNRFDELIAHVTNDDDSFGIDINNGAEQTIDICIRNLNLTPGSYSISSWLGRYGITYQRLFNIKAINIVQNSQFIRRKTRYPEHARIALKSVWKQGTQSE